MSPVGSVDRSPADADRLLALALSRPSNALAEARALLAGRPSAEQASVAHQAIGVVLRDFGDIDEAVTELRTALRWARRAGNPEREADVLASLGVALVMAGQTRRGLSALDEVVEASTARRRGRVHTGRILIRRAWACGRWAERGGAAGRAPRGRAAARRRRSRLGGARARSQGDGAVRPRCGRARGSGLRPVRGAVRRGRSATGVRRHPAGAGGGGLRARRHPGGARPPRRRAPPRRRTRRLRAGAVRHQVHRPARGRPLQGRAGGDRGRRRTQRAPARSDRRANRWCRPHAPPTPWGTSRPPSGEAARRRALARQLRPQWAGRESSRCSAPTGGA